MNKKVMMVTITLLTAVMLTTPLMGSVKACGGRRTQKIEDDLFIRTSAWTRKIWDPIEIGRFTFTHFTAGGYLMVANSPSGVLGLSSPILENPDPQPYPLYDGPLSWRMDRYGVSFTSRNGEEKTYNTAHATYCFTNGNLELTYTVEASFSAPDHPGEWLYGGFMKGYGTGGLKGVVVNARWDTYDMGVPPGAPWNPWQTTIEIVGTIWYPAELAT